MAVGCSVGINDGSIDTEGRSVGYVVKEGAGMGTEEGTGVGENDGACFAKLSFVNRNTKPSEFETRQ